MVNDKTLFPTNVVYTTHDWHDTIETSWCPYQLFHRTFSIDLTASIVSCRSCVVYTTFVGNSVLSFTTSKLNYNNINTFDVDGAGFWNRSFLCLLYMQCIFARMWAYEHKAAKIPRNGRTILLFRSWAIFLDSCESHMDCLLLLLVLWVETPFSQASFQSSVPFFTCAAFSCLSSSLTLSIVL